MTEKNNLTVERKIFLENWLNDHYPFCLNDSVYQKWRELFGDAEATYLYRAFKISYSAICLDLKKYDQTEPKMDEIKFASNLASKYDISYKDIIERIKDVRLLNAQFSDNLNEAIKIYNKLVRDKIAENIIANGEIPVTRILSAEEYWQALLVKDREELEEVKRAQTKAEICEELADKLAILIAMAEYHGLTIFEVEQKEIEKRLKKGGFSRRLYLEKVITKK